MPVLVYFLYVLFAPATAFTDGTCLPEYAVHVSRAQELCGLHFGSTQNQLFHGNDGPYSANRSPGQEILGRCAMSPSTASMHGMISGIPKKVRSVIDVRNWKDIIYNYVDNKTKEFAEKVRSVINEEF